jgi:hypothetical protein
MPVSIESTELNATNETLLNCPNISQGIILDDEEKARMVNYFNVLIEMDRAVTRTGS